MKKLLLFLLLLPALLSAQLQATKVFIPLGGGRSIPAIMYIAPGAPADAACFIFAAGKGEQMNKEQVNETTLTEGYNRLLNSANHRPLVRNCELYGFNLLVPLFVQAWNDWKPDWEGGKYMEACIDWAVANMPIDPRRVILTGLSSGGCAVLDACVRTQRLSGKIAGVVACAPGGIHGANWQLIADNHIPVWLFHCRDDKSTAPFTMSLDAMAAIQKVNASPAPRLTDLATGGHAGSWTYAYALAEMYTTVLTWKSDYAPVPPVPAKTIIARLYVAGLEVIVYSDKTAEVK